MTEQSALSIASAFLDAWTGQDLDAAGQHLASDFVFDGPIAHYTSAQEFLDGTRPFTARLKSWSRIAAFGDAEEALLLYDLVFVSGDLMRIADHYMVSEGMIQREQILWDTGKR
jgi:hypothetical protein